MLVLAVHLIVSDPPAAAPADDQPQEVLVTGRRFDRTRGIVIRNLVTRQLQCRITKTSGDARIDEGVCSVGKACFGHKGGQDAFTQCVADGRRRFLKTFVASEPTAQN